jgi:hypothetical protein
MTTIKLEYSEPLIRRTIKSYWWRQIGPVFLFITVAFMVFLIYLLLKGDRSWLVGLIGAVIFMAVSTMIATYVVHLKRSLTKLRNMDSPEAILELRDTHFRISSCMGSIEVCWLLIKEIWRFEDAWLIFFSSNEMMTLPIKNFNKDDIDFIISKAKQTGTKIL